MRTRLLVVCSVLFLALIAFGTTPASACGGYGYSYGGYGYGCGCPGYGYSYYRPAYAYAAPAYYARPAYAYYAPRYYARGWGYGPRAYYGWRGGRRW
jgi:hypothetical protein